MTQQTVVTTLSPSEQAELLERLRADAFEHRVVPHARLSVKGEGVVATLYNSGKLVVQGAEAELFTQRYLGRLPETSPGSPGAKKVLADPSRPLIGADEAGKGDYFGPLVAAAVLLPPEAREDVRRLGVADSKRLSDTTVARLAPVLEANLEHAVEVLDPPEYNAVWERQRNVNEVLADLHARAIGRLARPGMAVLIDRFAAESVMSGRLAGLGVELSQATRAESEPAVAAASVLARNAFVERLKELSEEWAVDLQKGAGEPTDRAAQRFVTLHGLDALGQVAKVHFKNTQRLRHGHA